MEYNSTRNDLIIREYGRHIQKMIEYLKTIPDREQRQRNAYAVIELMGMLNPHLKNVEDYRHKLWDHLYLIADFDLDVDSPYPVPTREALKARPDRLPYPKRHPRHRHLGRNIEVIIDKALHEENPEKKSGFTQCIGHYMKLCYNNWHKENVHDDMVRNELAELTGNQLMYESSYTPFVYQPQQTFAEGFRPNKRKNFGFKNPKNNPNGPASKNNRNNRFKPRGK